MISTVDSVVATRWEMLRIFSITGWLPLIVKFSMRPVSPSLPPGPLTDEKITPAWGVVNSDFYGGPQMMPSPALRGKEMTSVAWVLTRVVQTADDAC